MHEKGKLLGKSGEHTRRKAIAIRYDAKSDKAPRLVAKGEGLVAEKIIEIAAANDVKIHQDPAMVAILANLNVNTFVPEEIYQAVAEILAFVYRLDQKISNQV